MYISCFSSTCADFSVLNLSALKADLDSKLFGQHIASRIVVKAVNGFVTNDNPKKPLVLSLHGWAGTGKNFVSQLIAKNIYREGMDSKFVHVFTSELHFPHSSQLETYKVWWKLGGKKSLLLIIICSPFCMTLRPPVSAAAVDQRQRHQLCTLHVHLWRDGQDASRFNWQHKTIPRLLWEAGRGLLSESHLHLPQVIS